MYSSAGDLISQNGLNPSLVTQMLGVSRETLEQMTAKELVDGLSQSNEGANLLISNIYGINDSILDAGDSIIFAYNEGMFSAEALGEKADEILANIQNQMKITVENGHQDNQLISGDLDVISDQLNEMISESQEIVDEIYNTNLEWANMAEELNGILSSVIGIINKISNSLIPNIQSAVTEASKLKSVAASIVWTTPDLDKIKDAAATYDHILDIQSQIGNSETPAVSPLSTTTNAVPILVTKDIWTQKMLEEAKDDSLASVISELRNNTGISDESIRNIYANNKTEEEQWKAVAAAISNLYQADINAGFKTYTKQTGISANYTYSDVGESNFKERFLKKYYYSKPYLTDEDIYRIRTNLPRYATGGYTGDNVPASGALAVLDNKELVLNEDDTANMLKMIYAVRDMQNKVSINTNSSSILDGLNIDGIIKQIMQTTVQSFTAAAASISNFNISKEPQDINQNVSISANFPNVQNHNEIELAIQNLTSIAAQKAFSTRK